MRRFSFAALNIQSGFISPYPYKGLSGNVA